jgi:hypothetical protein
MSVSVRVGLWLIIRVICEICGFNTYLVAALPRWVLCGEIIIRHHIYEIVC